MATEKKLWEIEHPYYCQEGNYYSNEMHQNHESWTDFIAEMSEYDLDLNHVWRWDWREWEESETTEIVMYFAYQRKANYGTHTVKVTRDDEPKIRAYLSKHWEKTKALWEPFST